MALLGKILLFINLLVAGGLIYVGAQDWAKRQEITATALKYRLWLTGLPVEAAVGSDPDEYTLNIETTGGHVVETVRKSLLTSLFQGVDGGQDFGGTGAVVGNQIDEVKRVQEKTKTIIRGENTDALKLARLCGRFNDLTFVPGWLANMAESFEERDLIRNLARSDADAVPAAVERAEKMLDQKFEAILAKPNPKEAGDYADKLNAAIEKVRAAPQDATARQELTAVLTAGTAAASRDEGDRKRRIVHLLMHLDPGTAWQKRVALVTGLRTYQFAIADQATRMQDMARSTQRLLEMDQAAFIDQYQQLKNQALDRAKMLDQQEQIRASLQVRERADSEAVAQRKKQLAERLNSLNVARQEVAKMLAAQEQTEKALFAVQKQVGDALRQNIALEQKLSDAEAGKGR